MPQSFFNYQNAKLVGEHPKSSTEQNPQENAISLPVRLELHTESLRRSIAKSLDGEGDLCSTREKCQSFYLTDYD